MATQKIDEDYVGRFQLQRQYSWLKESVHFVEFLLLK